MLNSPQCSGGCHSGRTGAACFLSVTGGCGGVLLLSRCFPPQMCFPESCMFDVWPVTYKFYKLIFFLLKQGTLLCYVFTGGVSARLGTFKANLNCFYLTVAQFFFWNSTVSAEQLVFSYQEGAFFSKASRVVDSVSNRLDKRSLFGVTLLQGKAISWEPSRISSLASKGDKQRSGAIGVMISAWHLLTINIAWRGAFSSRCTYVQRKNTCSHLTTDQCFLFAS